MGLEKTPLANDYWTEFTTATGNVAADYAVVAFGSHLVEEESIPEKTTCPNRRGMSCFSR